MLDISCKMVQFLAMHDIILYSKTSIAAVESTHPPIQWVLHVLSLDVKRLGHEFCHSSLYVFTVFIESPTL